MDLRSNVPCSPYDMLAGVVMLPRTVAKARALQFDMLGDYIYNCPLDELLFEFLSISPGEFARAVEQVEGDEGLVGWLEESCPRSTEQKRDFNNAMRHKCPEGDEGQEWLREQRQRLAREDLHTYFEVLDADEGRF